MHLNQDACHVKCSLLVSLVCLSTTVMPSLQDAVLRAAVEKYGGKNWKAIGALMWPHL